MVFSWRGGPDSRRLLLWLLLFTIWEAGSGQLHYSIPEEAKHGTFVGRIAQDLGLELAELVPRLFRVASKDRGDLLEVNLQNGILFVNSRIDREALCGRSAECSIHLEVIVDRPLQVFHVEVEVRDINDNPPVFPVKEQKLHISESRMLDSRFLLEGASDADIGANSILTYRLDSNDYFTLTVSSKNEENKQVELVLRKSLDREDAPEHKLLLTATDGGKPELTGSVQLLVTVLDVNDNAPTFQQSEYEVRIMENSDNGTTVIRLNASDRDEGTNSAISYSFNRLVPPMVLEQFSIDTDTGEIIIHGNLDFEQVDVYKIRVDATDKGHPPMAGHCTVLVKVLDENDNVPQITLTSLSLPVREDAALDREENPQLKLLLTATDGGKPEFTGSVSLLIQVLDANDNAPVFDRSVYEVKMSENQENQTLVIWLNATDTDEGVNKEVEYSFSSLTPSSIRKKFLINEKTGEIKVNGAIDFEDRNNYEIHVDASDKGHPPLVAHCTVLVEILDENDNAPEIVLTSLSLPVKEDALLGTVIALISVADQDSGVNGQVTCSLTPHVPFKLMSTFRNYYSLVLDSALDRETTPDYKVVVTARDGGSPSLWATASVSVEVADVNDNAPAFAQPEYTVFVKENNPPGVHIFTVSAMDADAQENALVSYSLVERRVGERSLSSFVSVHAESGKVFALQPLDHEELELLQFQVSARDAGVPSLGSNVTLQVFVLDENDNAPILLGPQTVGTAGEFSQLVSRSVGAGHVVSKVRAVDADSGYNAWLSYELQPAVGMRSPFRVGLYTGEISTTRALDEADAPRQRLLVLDHGEPALTATATVLVSLLENSQAPKTSSKALVDAIGREASLVDVNVYLIIAICAVSSLLVLTLLLYTALRCSATSTDGACAPGKPVLVCSSAVGTWSYSQQRRQRVCSGEGPPKTDLMAFSPSLSQGPESAEERQPPLESEYLAKVRWSYSQQRSLGSGYSGVQHEIFEYVSTKILEYIPCLVMSWILISLRFFLQH
ncbi:Protocadherin alpha-9 [Lemmus lemmus]